MAEPLPSSPRRLSARHVMEPLVALAGGGARGADPLTSPAWAVVGVPRMEV